MAESGEKDASTHRLRGLPDDILKRADQADRQAIAKMSMAERFELTIALSEFAVRNAGAAKRT